MKWYLLAIWTLLLAAGMIRIRMSAPKPKSPQPEPAGCLTAAAKEKRPHWIAARAMDVNWRVQATDLRPPTDGSTPPHPSAFLGNYIGCNLAAGDPVALSDIIPDPRIPAAPGKLLRLFPLGDRDQGWNARSRVHVFAGPKEIIPDATVAAVVCRASCFAYLQIGITEDRLLDQQNAADLHGALLP